MEDTKPKINIEIGYQDTTTDKVSRCGLWTENYSGPHTYWTFPVTVPEVMPIEAVAEAAFVADNSPHELTPGGLAFSHPGSDAERVPADHRATPFAVGR